MSFNMKRLVEINQEVNNLNDENKLIQLRREVHDIWYDEHNFGLYDKEAREVYNKINERLYKIVFVKVYK